MPRLIVNKCCFGFWISGCLSSIYFRYAINLTEKVKQQSSFKSTKYYFFFFFFFSFLICFRYFIVDDFVGNNNKQQQQYQYKMLIFRLLVVCILLFELTWLLIEFFSDFFLIFTKDDENFNSHQLKKISQINWIILVYRVARF